MDTFFHGRLGVFDFWTEDVRFESGCHVMLPWSQVAHLCRSLLKLHRSAAMWNILQGVLERWCWLWEPGSAQLNGIMEYSETKHSLAAAITLQTSLFRFKSQWSINTCRSFIAYDQGRSAQSATPPCGSWPGGSSQINGIKRIKWDHVEINIRKSQLQEQG